MEALQHLLDNTHTPEIYAFILGLMTAVSPCPLAANITAIAYIGRSIENKKQTFINGIIYTLGRAVSYSLLGFLLYFGASKFHLSKIFTSNGEKILGPLLIIIGLLMLDVIKLKLPSFGKFKERIQHKLSTPNPLNSFFLGVVLALAFCPYSGVLYFGMLIPLTIASTSGLYLPAIFALATGLPVIIISYILAFCVSGIGTFYNKVQYFQKYFNRFAAICFIVAGLYHVYIFYISPLF